MIHYITLDTNKTNPKLFDTYENKTVNVRFREGQGARTFLQEYLNKHRIKPISIYQSDLPDKTQLICWYWA